MRIRPGHGRCGPWVTAWRVALVFWFASVSARAEDIEAIFSFYLNEVQAGEVFAILRDGDVLMARSDLEAAGITGFEASELTVGGRKLISLASVRPKLRFVVDEEDIALRVRAPAALFPSQRIDLAASPPDVLTDQRPSAFLNYGPRLLIPSASDVTASAHFEAGLSEANRLYYTSLAADGENGVTRGLTNVNFDDRFRLRRLTLGDTSVSAGPIGGAAVMGGVTFARDFAINPYFVQSPSMRFAASTELPATVDIYVNGIKVRSETLQPGAFTLDNLRGLTGAGTARYVVRDILGREQSYFRPYYIGPSVLAEGVEDYAVSAGLPRSAIAGESFSYLSPSMISYYRRGLSDAWTMGARAEGRWDRVSAGPTLSTSNPAGTFELEAGASASADDSAGLAGVFSYQFLSHRFNALASVRALTEEYATVSLDPEMDRSLFQVNTSLSVPVGNRTTFISQHTVDVHRDTPSFARVSALTQTQLSRQVSLTAQLALVTLAPPSSSWDGFVQLTFTPDSGFHSSVGVTTSDGEHSTNLQVSRSGHAGEDWAMSGALDVARTTRSSLRTRLQTKTNTISTYFDHVEQSASLAIEPAGSIVWVQDGGFFLSRPVYDGFALVRVPDVEGVRIFMNAQATGRTDERGYALVPSLRSYFPSRITLASEDVPLDYSLEQDGVTVSAPRRGAAYAEFAAERVSYYRGELVLVIGGERVVPVYGEFRVQNKGDQLVSPIGEGGVFEFEGLSTGKHQAMILFEAYRCRFSFEVEKMDAMLVDLGVLECTLE